MALPFRTLTSRCLCLSVLKPVRFNVEKCTPLRGLAGQTCFQKYFTCYPTSIALKNGQLSALSIRNFSAPSCKDMDKPQPPKPPGLIQRFRQMYRDYWYVLVPVHLATSAVWFGGFYYAVSSGVDIISMLQSIGVSERIITPMRDSTAGYFALAYALYKIATPVRYAVTVGGTTFSINKLTAFGWIKPVPTTERIKEIIQEKKEDLQDRYHETRQELRQRRDQMKERRSQVLEDLQRYKQEMRDVKKNEVKNK